MRYLVILICLICAVAVVTGCTDETVSQPVPLADTTPVNADPSPKQDVGTVETHGYIEVRVDPSGLPEHAKVEELVDRRYRVSLVSVSVPPPLPATLPVRVGFVANDKLSGVSCVVRFRLYRDDSVIAEASSVIAGTGVYVMDGSPFDVLAGLEAQPETLLVYVKADLLMIPEGTDPQTVDPNTLEAPAHLTGNMQSNPLKIDFTGVLDDLPTTEPLYPVTGLGPGTE